MPLWGNYSYLVWSATDELAEELLDLSEEDFLDEVNKRFYSQSHYGFGGYADLLPEIWPRSKYVKPPLTICSNESYKFKVKFGVIFREMHMT